MNRIRTIGCIFAMIILVVVDSGKVFGHCHDDDPSGCEKPFLHLISGDRWDEPFGNKVNYYIGTFPGPANLTVDTQWAASQWSNVEFDDEIVNFKLNYAGTTNRTVPVEDGWNVVDWGPEDWDPVTNIGVPAVVYRWYSSSNPDQLVECDMLVNYYAPYAPHQNQNFPLDKNCIRNVVTHEFGHWVRLMDVGDGIP